MRINLRRSQARKVATGLSIEPKNNTEVGVFLFRGQNPLEKHFQELPQEQETGRSLGKPQASTSKAKGSAVPGAASRPQHQTSQGMWLLVLSFPKERNRSRNSLLGPCLQCSRSRARNEPGGDVISLSCPSPLCLQRSSRVFCDVRTPGQHLPPVAVGISLWRPSWPYRRWRLQLLLHRFQEELREQD